jgi:hypothetical protein
MVLALQEFLERRMPQIDSVKERLAVLNLLALSLPAACCICSGRTKAPELTLQSCCAQALQPLLANLRIRRDLLYEQMSAAATLQPAAVVRRMQAMLLTYHGSCTDVCQDSRGRARSRMQPSAAIAVSVLVMQRPSVVA